MYEVSKAESERIVINSSKSQFPYTILRPPVIFGPFDQHSTIVTIYKLISKFNVLLTIGNNDLNLQTIYVPDFVKVAEICLNSKNSYNQDFIITSYTHPFEYYSELISQLLHCQPKHIHIPLKIAKAANRFLKLINQLGFSPPVSPNSFDYLSSNRIFSSVKARQLIKIPPPTPLKSALMKTLDWYRRGLR